MQEAGAWIRAAIRGCNSDIEKCLQVLVNGEVPFWAVMLPVHSKTISQPPARGSRTTQCM